MIAAAVPVDIPDRERFALFATDFYRFFHDQHFAYLEINPFCFDGDQVHLLDLVAKVDDTAGFLMDKRWGPLYFPTRITSYNVCYTKLLRMAKWYQTASSPEPNAEEKMLAMPTASEGAPPVRANSVASPIWRASSCICTSLTGKPQPEIVATAVAGSAPTMPAGLLMAKNTPGSSTVAVITSYSIHYTKLYEPFCSANAWTRTS